MDSSGSNGAGGDDPGTGAPEEEPVLRPQGETGEAGKALEPDAAPESGAEEPETRAEAARPPAWAYRWESIPARLRSDSRTEDTGLLRECLNNPNLHSPAVDVTVLEARSFGLPFFVSREVIRNLRSGGKNSLTDAERKDIDGHPSRDRLRLVQFTYSSANGSRPGDVYIGCLIADYGEDGKQLQKLIALDYTNLPLFKILQETRPQMRFHPRGAALFEGDSGGNRAKAGEDILAYLEFHLFAVRASGGRFLMVSRSEEVVDRFVEENSMKLGRQDLEGILDKVHGGLFPAFYWDSAWEPMVDETPVEHVAMGVDSSGRHISRDDWWQPIANSVHRCVAHLLFRNRIYRATISLTELSGAVDLTTLQVLAADLPVTGPGAMPYDRLEMMKDGQGLVRYRPPGWTDAVHVKPHEFIEAARRGYDGFRRLYYWHHLREDHPLTFAAQVAPKYPDPMKLLDDKDFVLGNGWVWMESADRCAFYLTEAIDARGEAFLEPINVRAWFEDHVIFESCEFQNSLNFSRCVFRRNLDLSNCEIEGSLDLSGTLIEASTAYRRGKARLDLDHAVIKGPFIARGLRVGRSSLVSIRKSRETRPGREQIGNITVAVRPISARSITIEGDVDLRAVNAGALDFDSARIRGNLRLSSEQFDDSSQDPGIHRRGMKTHEDLFRENLDLQEAAELHSADWRKVDALACINLVRLDFADVDGDVMLCGLHTLYLFMRSTGIRGNLYLGPAQLQREATPTTAETGRVEDCIVTHILRCLDMDFADVRGIIHGEGLRTGLVRRAEVIYQTLLNGRYKDWERLPAVYAQERLPPGDVHMSFIEASAIKFGSFPVSGADRAGLIRTQISGMVAMQGVQTKGPVELDGALLAGNVDLSLSKIGGMVSAKPADPFICEIYGDLNLTNTEVSGAAEFYGMWVGRSLRMPDASFEEFFMRSTCVGRAGPCPEGEDALTHRICNPNVGHQFTADNVKVRGTMNLTGIQIGFRTTFQGERRDGDRDESRDRLNMRYADIKGPFLLWQGATIRTVARGATGESPDETDEDNIAAASFYIRTRIFGDIKLNHAEVGAGLCLINTLVTGRAIFSDVKVGGDIKSEWSRSLPRPETDTTAALPGNFFCPSGGGGSVWADHEWKQALAHLPQDDMDGPRLNYLQAPDTPGRFQCCRLSLELVECRGDGFFCDTEVFDLENPCNEAEPPLPFDENNPLTDPADYAPDFLARQASFQGRIELAPWRDEAEKLTTLSRRSESGENTKGREETLVRGKLDLSFCETSFAVLDAGSFRSTMLDYKDVYERLEKLLDWIPRLERRLHGEDRGNLRKFLEGRRRTPLKRMPAHLRKRLDDLLPERNDNGSGFFSIWKGTTLPKIRVAEIRRLDLNAFGVDLERASIAHLEFLPFYRKEEKEHDRKRKTKFHIIGGKRNYVEFPQSVNLHGLEVKRWDIDPGYFRSLIDAQPGYEQSTYTMIQRELQDQGHVGEAMEIYAQMREEQRKFKTGIGHVVDWLEAVCFRYFTRPMTWKLFGALVFWFILSTLIFLNPYNVMPAPDAIENTDLTWRSSPCDAINSNELHSWGLGDAALVSLHYHLPFLSLRPGEKWQASDTEPITITIPRKECPPPRQKADTVRNGDEDTEGAPAMQGAILTKMKTEGPEEKEHSEDELVFTAELYASITALVHWLIYPFVIIAMSVTVVRNRTAGQGRTE